MTINSIAMSAALTSVSVARRSSEGCLVTDLVGVKRQVPRPGPVGHDHLQGYGQQDPADADEDPPVGEVEGVLGGDERDAGRCGDEGLKSRVTCLAGIALPERERVRLGAGLEEGDLQRSITDSVVLAHELVHAAVA